MSIKLIACDMDGTLLTSNRQISEVNKKAIKKALDSGVVVTIATGRMFSSVEHYAKELGMDVPLVVYNGALIQESLSKEILGNYPVPCDVANEVLAYCKEHNYYVHTYVDDVLYVYEDSEFARMYADFAGVSFTVKGEELYHLKKAPHKLLMITPPGKCMEVQEEMKKLFQDKVHVTNSQDDFIEIVDPNTSKWNAILHLAKRYNIEKDEIMCIGDSNNDFEMVKNAAIGVAMGNANDRLKDVAKVITGTNDNNGVAMIIDSILAKQIDVPL